MVWKNKINFAFSILVLGMLLNAHVIYAEPVGILVIDLDRAYNSSKFGQSIRKNFEIENRSFNKENDTILKALKEEEIKLTEDRKKLSPEDFAKAAEVFDKKVVEYSKKLKPSSRNELEITDLLKIYLNKKQNLLFLRVCI